MPIRALHCVDVRRLAPFESPNPSWNGKAECNLTPAHGPVNRGAEKPTPQSLVGCALMIEPALWPPRIHSACRERESSLFLDGSMTGRGNGDGGGILPSCSQRHGDYDEFIPCTFSLRFAKFVSRGSASENGYPADDMERGSGDPGRSLLPRFDGRFGRPTRGGQVLLGSAEQDDLPGEGPFSELDAQVVDASTHAGARVIPPIPAEFMRACRQRP